jgi:carbon monoxide dehydrogenase subunit G
LQLEHSFTVPAGIDDAWKVLLDIERVAPCMPGAALETIDGDDFTGTVKVKLGPIALTYKGKASFVEKDEATHRATINAQGRDARGNGTASAKVTATLTDQGGDTKVDVVTDLDITGKPAQFGRGVMADVGNKLIGQFADCLAGKLGGGSDVPAESGPATSEPPPKKAVAKKAPAKATKAAARSATKATAEKATPAKRTAAAKKSTPAATAPIEATAPTPAEQPSANGASEPVSAPEPVSAAEPTPAAAPTPVHSGPRHIAPSDVEPIDLLEHAGPAVAKRLVPVVAAVVLLLIILRLRKR